MSMMFLMTGNAKSNSILDLTGKTPELIEPVIQVDSR